MEGYKVFPQYSKVNGVIDFAITYESSRVPILIFFVEVKIPLALKKVSSHTSADVQMHQHFQAILDAFTPIPLPALISICFMSTVTQKTIPIFCHFGKTDLA
jgi:hypothetical protein